MKQPSLGLRTSSVKLADFVTLRYARNESNKSGRKQPINDGSKKLLRQVNHPNHLPDSSASIGGGKKL